MPAFVVIDTETTGISPQLDRVIEVGAVFLDDALTPVSWTSSLVHPGRPVRLTDVHGITDQHVAKAPRFAELAPSVLGIMQGLTVVGHNLSFDLRFLGAELGRAGQALAPLPTLDTLYLARKVLRGSVQNHRLGTLAQHFGLPHGVAHTALDDAYVTALLLKELATLAKWSPGMPLSALGLRRSPSYGGGGLPPAQVLELSPARPRTPNLAPTAADTGPLVASRAAPAPRPAPAPVLAPGMIPDPHAAALTRRRAAVSPVLRTGFVVGEPAEPSLAPPPQ